MTLAQASKIVKCEPYVHDYQSIVHDVLRSFLHKLVLIK